MSCPKKKKKDPPTCVPPSRRLLETKTIKELSQTVCPYATPCGPGTSEPDPCECDQDDCGPGRCCALELECDKSGPQDLEPCDQACKVAELDNIIEEIQSARDLFRKLTVEAKYILETANSQKVSDDACCQPLKKPTKQESCCSQGKDDLKPSKSAKPIAQSNRSYGKIECPNCLSPKYSGLLHSPSPSKLHAMPTTSQKTPSRTCSVPIAQTACKVTEGKLCQMKSDEEEERLKSKIENKPEDKNKIGKNFFKKLLGKKPSQCSCDEEMLKQNKENEKIVNMAAEKKGKQSSLMKVCCPNRTDCECKVDGKNKDGKEWNKNNDCFCDDGMGKQKKMDDGCVCHFPPAFSQYFNCTGQVSGNCCCTKKE